jgi:hypothetical protein
MALVALKRPMAANLAMPDEAAAWIAKSSAQTIMDLPSAELIRTTPAQI